jgi:hypothetical protein
MAFIVAAIGVVVAVFGALGLVSPNRLEKLLSLVEPRSRFFIAVLSRIVIGVALLVAGGDTRFPIEILVLGLLALLAGIALIALGAGLFDALVRWFLGWPSLLIRFWAAAAITIGAFLVYASF